MFILFEVYRIKNVWLRRLSTIIVFVICVPLFNLGFLIPYNTCQLIHTIYKWYKDMFVGLYHINCGIIYNAKDLLKKDHKHVPGPFENQDFSD